MRQFVAMPLGEGYTVEEQITDEARFGGIQIVAFDPKPGTFPDDDPAAVARRKQVSSLDASRPFDQKAAHNALYKLHPEIWEAGSPENLAFVADGKKYGLQAAYEKALGLIATVKDHDPKLDVFGESSLAAAATKPTVEHEMGIGAGGKIKQEIAEDYYGAESWNEDCRGKTYIRIVNSAMFEQITGRKAPSSPVSAKQYTEAGLPWFDYYDETMPAVLPSGILAGIKPVGALDKAKGQFQREDDETVRISPEQLRRIAVPSKNERLAFLHKSALACFDAKRFDLAKRNADLLIELSPNDAVALRIRAECYLHFRKWEHAEADASDCLRVDSENSFTWRTRAKANLRLGEFEQAAKDASESLERHPDNVSALSIRAEAYLGLKRYEEAISDCSGVLQLDTHHDGALRIRAESYRMTSRYPEAVADATASLNLCPASVFALNTRADSFRRLGNSFDARRDAKEALQLAPGNEFAEGVLEKLEKQ